MTLQSPTKSSRLIEATPFFYGWVILIIGTIGSIMMGPSQTFTVGIFLDFLIVDLDSSRATMSLIYGGATLTASFMLPLTGRLVDRYGPTRMLLLVAFGLGLVTIGMGWVQTLLMTFLGFLALRFFGFGSLQLVSNNAIAQWFIRRRGLVMGLSGLSLPIGLVIFPWLAELLIRQFEWRGAWVVMGLLVWGVMLPLGWIFLKDRPELYGLTPDGDGPPSTTDLFATPVNERHWTLAEARQTGIFWLFLVALSSMTLIMAGLVFHQVSLFAVRGLSREISVTAFTIMAAFAVIGNLGLGRLLDKYSARLLLALVLGCLAGSMILVQVMATAWQAFLYAAFLGLASGSFRVMDSTVWAKYFGRRYLGQIKGMTAIGVIGSTSLGPYVMGASLDYLGSYNFALTGLLLLPLGSGLLAFFVQRPKKGANSLTPSSPPADICTADR